MSLAAVLLPLMVVASFDFGVTWDERSRHLYGERIWQYLRGLRPASEFSADTDGNFYGGLFDTLCAAVETFIPADRFVVRHGLNALFGWVGLLYMGRLAGRLFGPWAAVVGLMLGVVSPRYLGESMNNPKDLPFAAMSTAALYYIAALPTSYPYVTLRSAAPLVIALALALSIRVGALIYLGYFGLFVIGCAIARRTLSARQVAATAGRLAAVSVAVLVFGTVAWPWAQQSPLLRPLRALLGFAGYPYGAPMLFAGRVITADALPLSYVPWWFLITTPPVVIAGVALALTLGWTSARRPVALLAGVAAFPMVMAVAMQTTLYDGVRHLLFAYPPLVVLAAGGWASLAAVVRHPVGRRVTLATLIAGLIGTATWEARAYPNEIVYFNGLVGGPRGAFGRYDMDYWGNCLLEAVAWSANLAHDNGRALVISGDPTGIVQQNSYRFSELQFAPPSRRQHHLDVRLARGSTAGVQGLATRTDGLYRVTTHDGAVLCVVVPGPAFDNLGPEVRMPPPGLSAHALLRRVGARGHAYAPTPLSVGSVPSE